MGTLSVGFPIGMIICDRLKRLGVDGKLSDKLEHPI